ncbi:MAG: beta-N-acetylglucosaminidase domain-containing protein [Acidimicrobiales bacterium]
MSDAPAVPPVPSASGVGPPSSGVIEAFYGPPWSWDDRLDVMRWCHERGMSHYVYAPKDDPLHRERWREPYDAEALAGFERLVGAGTLEVGFGISPGLSIDYRSTDDRRALVAKVDQLLAVGVGVIALLLDDIPVRPGLGTEHAELTAWLRDHLADRATLVLTPTEYTGTRSTPYLDALAERAPADVPIGWTGPTVVCDEISVADADARSGALGGRRPLLWDNYPVNDLAMADRLFLGPIRGREPGLAAACSGYFANPMLQPMASKPALSSIAALVRGDDPEAAWAADIGPLRTFAEACDGVRPWELVDAALGDGGPTGRDDALDALEGWLRDARTCEAPGLEGEVDAWLDQARAEGRLGLTAVKLIRAKVAGEAPSRLTELSMALAATWPSVRRDRVSVMGPRCSFRPVIAQDDEGEWSYRPASLTLDRNAVDRLVRAALDR